MTHVRSAIRSWTPQCSTRRSRSERSRKKNLSVLRRTDGPHQDLRARLSASALAHRVDRDRQLMTNIRSSLPQITGPIRTRNPSGYGGARPEITRPAFAGRQNIVLSRQNFCRMRPPIDKNGPSIRHPAFAPLRDIENSSVAVPKSP